MNKLQGFILSIILQGVCLIYSISGYHFLTEQRNDLSVLFAFGYIFNIYVSSKGVFALVDWIMRRDVHG